MNEGAWEVSPQHCGDQEIAPDDGTIKERLNNLLWQILPNTTTLAQAERLACQMHAMIEKARGVDPAYRDDHNLPEGEP